MSGKSWESLGREGSNATALPAPASPRGLEGQTLACLWGRMPAAQQRESSDSCQGWISVPECAQCPCHTAPRCRAACFARSDLFRGKTTVLPSTSFQIEADYPRTRSSGNVLISVCQSLPTFPAGVWLMPEGYALRMCNEVSAVVKPLCYSAVTFPSEPFLFILRPSRSGLFPSCSDIPDVMGEGQHTAWLSGLLCGWADAAGQCPLHL